MRPVAALKRRSSTVAQGFVLVPCKVKIKVKGSGQECPLHTIKILTALLRFLFQGDGEVGLAGFGGVDEGAAFAAAFGGAEEEALLGAVGQSDEAGLAAGTGADLEVELADVHESVGDVDVDVGGIDRRARIIDDLKVGGTGADGAIDHRNGFGVGGSGVLGLCGGQGKDCEQEYAESDFAGCECLHRAFKNTPSRWKG